METVMDSRQLEELGIRLYPDNDGGLWYKDPATGQTITID